MHLTLRDEKSILNISDTVFNFDYNESLVHQVIVAYLSGMRQGSRAQKSRANVSGSGKKPWRQKGTGRARAGSLRSPIWRSGGVTFAAKPKNFSKKVNRKMYRGALKSIFSELIRTSRLSLFKNFSIVLPKTQLLIKKLRDIQLNDVLIIVQKRDNNLYLASRNLYTVDVKTVDHINPVDLVAFKNVVVTSAAIKEIEELLV